MHSGGISYLQDSRNPAVSRIHLLKMMIVELKAIQTITYTAAGRLWAAESFFSGAGLAVTGSDGGSDAATSRVASTENLSFFSGSDMVTGALENWELTNEWKLKRSIDRYRESIRVGLARCDTVRMPTQSASPLLFHVRAGVQDESFAVQQGNERRWRKHELES